MHTKIKKSCEEGFCSYIINVKFSFLGFTKYQLFLCPHNKQLAERTDKTVKTAKTRELWKHDPGIQEEELTFASLHKQQKIIQSQK